MGQTQITNPRFCVHEICGSASCGRNCHVDDSASSALRRNC